MSFVFFIKFCIFFFYLFCIKKEEIDISIETNFSVACDEPVLDGWAYLTTAFACDYKTLTVPKKKFVDRKYKDKTKSLRLGGSLTESEEKLWFIEKNADLLNNRNDWRKALHPIKDDALWVEPPKCQFEYHEEDYPDKIDNWGERGTRKQESVAKRRGFYGITKDK